MIIGIKDIVKLAGMAIVVCCAVFVCTLFLNYNIDLAAMEGEILTEAGIILYHAQVSMGKVTAAVTGGCLVVTSAIMLLFYIKNYIDTHGRELGILKALGYSDMKIAKHFWPFGLSALTGCVAGFALAFSYLPFFYKTQNAEGLFPDIGVNFHPLLAVFLIAVPAILFAVLSVFYACLKLKAPVLDLLRERREYKNKIRKKETGERPFLQDLKRVTRERKTLVFFVAFSAFCFSAMVQMSVSMNELASGTFAVMVITIGLILAYITLFLSLSSVVKGNTKTIAMMRVFGYGHSACCRAILGGYRPFAYMGFAVGTVYQYALLKSVMMFIFADIENMPAYTFDVKVFFVTLVLFLITYEMVMYGYSARIKKLSVKSVMLE
ncbi:MAG: ABC transporter permease [Lachnospiraceae bacterium]|nr:ABC transporter permease [Lachnospiraceae bacterium]